MKQIIQTGATSVRQRIAIINSSTGQPITGLVYNSSGLIAYFFRDGDTSPTAITLATAAVGTFTSGGFIQINAADMPGVYEIGLPNTVFANTVRDCIVCISGYSGMAPVYLEFQLVPWNPQDGVRLGLTALPNVAAGAAGGLPTATNSSGQVTASGVSGNVTGSVASVTGNVAGSVASVTGAVGSVTAAVTTSGASNTAIATAVAAPSAATIATAVMGSTVETAGGDSATTVSIALRLLIAAINGITSGMNGATGLIKSTGGTKTVGTYTLDGNGNRTAFTPGTLS